MMKLRGFYQYYILYKPWYNWIHRIHLRISHNAKKEVTTNDIVKIITWNKDTVIAGLNSMCKNQNGLLIMIGNPVLSYDIHFKCPICKNYYAYSMGCWDTIEALIAIGNNNFVRLLCINCDSIVRTFEHYELYHKNSDKRVRLYAKMMKKVGWIE